MPPREKARNKAEEKIETIREEVLKAMERLEQIETEGKENRMSWVEKARLSAAAQAVRELRNGTTVGLGSGTTVLKALDLAGERIKKEHLNINLVPTSYQMEMAARRLGLKITTLPEEAKLDLALDGADQV